MSKPLYVMTEQMAMKEIIEYYNIKQKEGQNWIRNVSYIYIINKLWFEKWKQYTNKDYIIKHYNITCAKPKQVFQSSFIETFHPSTISNNELIVSLNEFWNDGNIENEDNIVIADMPKDNLKIISKRRWDYFISKYQGGPEIKAELYINKTNNQKLIDILKQKMKVLFLPIKSTIIGDDNKINEALKNIHIVYISKRKTIGYLKQLLFNTYNSKVTEKNNKIKAILHMRLCLFKYSIRELSKVLIKYFGLNASRTESKLNEKIIEIESISSLEQSNAVIENKYISINDIIIIETGEAPTDFYFKMKTIIVKEGKCPGCKETQVQQLPIECPCKEEWYCSEYCRELCFKSHSKECPQQGIEEDNLVIKSGSKMGMTALQNLGNTCFLNTSLQCISNCWELSNYFLKNHYKKDINKTNVLGTHGRVTRSFANLIKHLWYGEENLFTPTNFKLILENENEMYQGNVQQDANEFLTYLLDCIHEDLNRVIEKPYVINEDNRKDDNVKSTKFWYNFFQRNQSIIVDLFYGQFQSFVYCQIENCGNISSTFEPFLCLSLPLVRQTSVLDVLCYFVFFDLSIKPIKIKVPFASNCNVMALRNKIGTLFNIHPFSFLIAKMIPNGRQLDYFSNAKRLLLGTSSSTNKDKDQTNNIKKGQEEKNKMSDKPYFLFQIDPKLFYDPEINNLIKSQYDKNKDKKIRYKTDHYETIEKEINSLQDNKNDMFKEDYDENELGLIEENDESYYQLPELSFGKILKEANYGFNKDYLLVLLNFSYHDSQIHLLSTKKTLIFPRPIYIHKQSKCKDIHVLVYNYLKHLYHNDSFDIQFPNIANDYLSKDTYQTHKENKYPYRLRIVNIIKDQKKPCLICKKNDCFNCLFPYSDDTLQSIINLYPKNNTGKKIDNSFHYMFRNQKEKHHKLNKDFELELTFLYIDKIRLFNQLNDIVKQEFQITKKTIVENISLTKCLNNFIKIEELDSTNEWICPKCHTPQRAKTKISIYRIPHFIIIQLKRFNQLSKNNLLVEFPINGLDMSNYVLSNAEKYPLLYDLFAIANHSGDISFGHYYTICKNPLTGQWFKYDDSNIEPIPRKKIINHDAYILFYRRRSLENYLDLQALYNSQYINYNIDLNQIEVNYQVISQVMRMESI